MITEKLTPKELYDRMCVWLADVDDPATMMADWEDPLDFNETREHFMDRAYDIMMQGIKKYD